MRRAVPKANTEKCYGFALGITNLQSFSAETRIATSRGSCPAPRNDMQKAGTCARAKTLACNDMLKAGRRARVQGGSAGVLLSKVLANADTQQVSACHCEERSDVAIRFSCGSTKQEAAPKANTENYYGFALGITNLQSFSAGTRIATSRGSCPAPRNDMQKAGTCARAKTLACNDMLKAGRRARVRGRGSQ